MSKHPGKVTAWVLGDQLTPELSSLEDVPRDECVVLMIESIEHSKRLPFHKQKLILVWSAMRHFAEELRALGYEVDYYEVQPDFRQALRKHTAKYRPAKLRIMDSAEFGVARRLADASGEAGIPAVVTPNTMFLSDRERFQRESENKRSRLMESFYRRMRKRTGVLMSDGKPVGGKWNYDADNRKRAPADLQVPRIPGYPPDAVTERVRAAVEKEFPKHFGRADTFAWPVTRKQANHFLGDFLKHRLADFGAYQDAMVTAHRTLFHSLLAPLLNIGVLDPLVVCRKAEQAYRDGEAPLNSVEGFIRQILGWREYVYQVYHWRMPEYAGMNELKADLPLPDFYWTADTPMLCISKAVEALIEDGINHHIQRLMLTGNLALIAGFMPRQVNEWYWLAYVDAHEWVVTPNVLGMALYADGGILGTKPYAASANYINRMSDYCRECPFDPRSTVGNCACPFNALYWGFLARNEAALRGNPRMALAYRNLDRRRGKGLDETIARADQLRALLAGNKPLL